jgi:hypothetical protein
MILATKDFIKQGNDPAETDDLRASAEDGEYFHS